MYFFVDAATNEIDAFQKLSVAAKTALKVLEVDCPAGADPVKLANEKLGERGVLLNVSGAFEAISESDDRAAQELALKFKEALDKYYENRS